MNVKIVSLHWQNMNDRIVWGQGNVFKKFNIPITQHCIDGLDHADWMQWVTDTSTVPLILFVDVDCIITDPKKVSYWVTKAANGALVGNIQSTNHLGAEVAKKTFAAPSFMVVNKNVYEQLDKPSFKASPHGDVGQLLTDTWRFRSIPVHLIPVTHFEQPKWALAGVPDSYGIGTTFGDCNYHLFESRNNDNVDLFCNKVEEVMKK